MYIVCVYIQVRPEFIDEFRVATELNARQSIKEPGIARFDVLQQQDDPTKFMLIEVYRTEKDPAKHKQTSHYAIWRDCVEKMMAEPRSSIKYINIHPGEAGWDTLTL